MKADISTLLKPDILILQRQRCTDELTASAAGSTMAQFYSKHSWNPAVRVNARHCVLVKVWKPGCRWGSFLSGMWAAGATLCVCQRGPAGGSKFCRRASV